MESKLTVCVCLVTLALFYLIAPGESQAGKEVLRDQQGIDQFVCTRDLKIEYDFMNGPIQCGQDQEPIPLGWFHERPPRVKYEKAEKDARYLLVMVDPDAPSAKNPEMAYWRHWLVTYISGEDLQKGIPSQDWSSVGRTLTSYKPPTPPKGSGLHHYQFFLYRLQPGQDKTLNSDSRGKFDLPAFAADLGPLVAATEFKTENPEKETEN
ncbi:phosphatidylethanolamine-binding protein 4-like isoform X2 [Branchiostoma floridae]|uniref:Phosphatidylethanolamine-binding protein 4-like isoform X2 n=1 Tax=Branchiostoma floridae TaxID=7739 RepID=A0A9J7MNI1_BRAFL|nr:phosphatidylethanolamine-binding protein 4-like isoform X2 [Branchiostoma floridae]